MFSNKRFVDLTHPLDESVPSWTGRCGFEASKKLDYEQGCLVYAYKMHGGIGTHIDAPSHFFQNGSTIAEMDVKQFFAPGHLIDVRKKSHADYFISKEDIVEYESTFGSIKPHSIVLAYTGWLERWSNTTTYRNEDENGDMHFPGFDEEAACYLIEKDINGIGIDTLSPDGSNMSFPVHKKILGAGKFIIENVTNLSAITDETFSVVSLPIRVSIGAEAACRTVAILD